MSASFSENKLPAINQEPLPSERHGVTSLDGIIFELNSRFINSENRLKTVAEILNFNEEICKH